MSITKILEFEEGFRARPYLCSEGFVTIGLGSKLHNNKGMNPKDFPLNINLETAKNMLAYDVSNLYDTLGSRKYAYMFKVFKEQSLNRREILMSMMYQMGVDGVHGFKKMWTALDNKNYTDAASEMLDSRWAKQTPARANRHAIVMTKNSFNVYDNYLKG